VRQSELEPGLQLRLVPGEIVEVEREAGDAKVAALKADPRETWLHSLRLDLKKHPFFKDVQWVEDASFAPRALPRIDARRDQWRRAVDRARDWALADNEDASGERV